MRQADGHPRCDVRHVSFRRQGFKASAHAVDVGHGAACAFLRQYKMHLIPGFEQDILRVHQRLTHGPIGSLSEVTALRVLLVGPSARERDDNIR